MESADLPRVLQVHQDWVAVHKPSGWLVHPAGTDAPDLIDWLDRHGPGAGLVPVHRLDRGTSGVVLYAPRDRADALTERFRAGEVDKTYLALVFGRTRDHGRVRRPLADARRGRPLEAETRYETVERFERWSLVEVHPVTGRKHQIRRHLQGIGHALVGDERYRARGKPTVPAFPGRLWLHASTLAFGDVVLKAPLPPRLQDHLALLRQRTR